MYNPKSHNADEFISHTEILDTLKFADENKDNIELIDKILDKARLGKGLTHREASVLLACNIDEKNNEIFELAKKIKLDYYGNRIVMFAPLYLSNYCVNGCVYCPYHAKNKHIPRRKLTQEEIKNEVINILTAKGFITTVGRLTISRIYENFENIYKGYALEKIYNNYQYSGENIQEIDKQFFMYPYAGLRIEFELVTRELC